MSNHVRAVPQVSSIGYIGAARSTHELALPFYLVKPAVVAVDIVLVVAASVFAGVGYHWYFLNRIPDLGPYASIGGLAALNFVTTLIALGSYSVGNLVAMKRQVRHVTGVMVCVFLTLLGIAFSLKIGATLSRGSTFGFLIIGSLFLLVWRVVLRYLLLTALENGSFAKQRMILIGERSVLSRSPAVRELRQYGYVPCASLEIRGSGHQAKALADTLNVAIRMAREKAIENIFLFISWEKSHLIEVILNALSVLPIRVHLVPDEKVIDYLRQTHRIGAIWTAELKRTPLSKSEQALKRGVDLMGAGLALLLLSPLMAATALLIKLGSGGPIFFVQSRNGFNGRLFRIFKFRTMTVLEDGPVIRQATREDARCTPLGRWLRRTSIDELPQLINVLRGQMSLVGPRPHAAAHDCKYERKIAAYAFRYHVKPGITGWAQVNGYRGETRTLSLMSTRVELDLWYIKNWSIWLDLKILLNRSVAMSSLLEP